MHIQLFDPASGNFRRETVERLREALEALGAMVALGESSALVPLRIEPTAERLCVIGGDGTVRHALLALRASGPGIPVNNYPGGTVNLLHREAGGPTEIDDYVHFLLNSPAKPLYSASLTCAG